MIDGYKSPITIIQEEMTRQINMDMENGILKAVQRYNIDVDKEELLKALKYDRDQYDKGYQDGYKDGLDADEWIPCSERLPNNLDNVLVWCDGYYQAWVGWYSEFKHKWFVIDYDGECEKYEVIAWQPLPQAYMGE